MSRPALIKVNKDEAEWSREAPTEMDQMLAWAHQIDDVSGKDWACYENSVTVIVGPEAIEKALR